MVDLRQSPKYGTFMQNIGWNVERIENVNYFIKKFPLIGSFIKIQRPVKIDYQITEKLRKKYRAFRIIIEPVNSSEIMQLTSHKFYLSKSPFLPSKTIHIDLTKTENSLLKEMHHKTRYNIRKFYNSLSLTHNSTDISSFADFWQSCSFKQRGMFLSQKKEIVELFKAWSKSSKVIFAKDINGKILAGILLIMTKDTSYYMYAASSDEGKKVFAPTIAVWYAIKLSKKLGKKVFDFEGIYDGRFPIKSWEGFTRFKKSFGGKEFEYPGAYSQFSFPF